MASEQMTLRDVLAIQASRREKQIFLEFNNRHFSFADVDNRTDRVATGLSRLGLGIGARVVLLMSNRPEYVFFLLGLPKIGMIPCTVSVHDPESSIAEAIRSSGASAVVTESRFATLRGRIPSVKHWIVVDDNSFAAPPFGNLEEGSILGFWPDLDPRDPALISPPERKGPGLHAVVLTHGNLIAAAQQLLQPFRVDGTDRFFCALPLSAPLSEVLFILTPWISGATCVLHDGPPPGTAADIDRTGSSVIAGTPAMFRQIAASPDFERSRLPSLRLALCIGGAVEEEMFEAFEQRHDALIVEGYGLAAGAGLTCANPYTGVRKHGSIGLPLPGQECRIVDSDDRELPAGAAGEIVVRGPNVMKQYDGDAGASAQALREGWLHTGDQGYVDCDGYYHLGSPASQ